MEFSDRTTDTIQDFYLTSPLEKDNFDTDFHSYLYRKD